jgi:STE24 endopeptidase
LLKRLLTGIALGTALGMALTLALWPQPAAAQEPPVALPTPGPGPHGDRRQLEVRVTPEMVQYSQTRYALYFGRTLAGLLILTLLLSTGVSARLRAFAERKSRNPIAQACIYYPLLLGLYTTLMLPLSFYSGFLLPHQYGLSTQALPAWLGDALKRLLVSAGVGAPVVAFFYWTVRRWPRHWWLPLWVASIPMMTLMIVLAPLIIAPLYNRFQPLRDEALREKILALANEAGIERGRVFEADASRRTRSVNAYVTGLGGSARIVLWDTLIERLDEEEVLFVMAHEMGHYVERHILVNLLVSISGTLFVLLFIDRAARLLVRRNGRRWGVSGLEDLASLPAVLLLLSLLNFFGSPVESAVSRTLESRADAFALQLTGDGEAAASSFIKLSEHNLSHPSPPRFIELWMFSHPPLQRRIERALAVTEGAANSDQKAE